VQRNAPVKSAKLQLLSEVLLSLNLALVLSYYYLVPSFKEVSYSKYTSDAYTFLYYFSRVAVRLNRPLHYPPSGYKKYVRWPNAGGRLGVELAFALTTVFLGRAISHCLALGAKLPQLQQRATLLRRIGFSLGVSADLRVAVRPKRQSHSGLSFFSSYS
jgi:hypothetical protein